MEEKTCDSVIRCSWREPSPSVSASKLKPTILFPRKREMSPSASLPAGEVLPKGVLKQFSQENGPEILLLAQGPADDFLKLSIIRNPDPGTQEAFLKQDAAQTEKHCKKLIGELESQLGTGKAEATCGKVENNGVAALATQMTIPAQDNRPELINMTWTYPNGDKGVIANAMFLKKDAGKYEADVKKALQSVKFDK